MVQVRPYPKFPSERTQWIRKLRETVIRPTPDTKPQVLLEKEVGPEGNLLQTGTVFLINRECPWTCAMCDLWKHTTTSPLSPGHAPQQLKAALAKLESTSDCSIEQVKIYNSGSFFDARAIHTSDYPSLAKSLSPFNRVILENHPKLIGKRITSFHGLLNPTLEIAMGLEAADDKLLDLLNKRFSLDDYRKACDFLHTHAIAHRAFIMVQPPFSSPSEAVDLCIRTAKFAFDHEASCVSLIPSRATTGAMHSLSKAGHFLQPSLVTLERCFNEALKINRGRVFVDLWDLELFSHCHSCFELRRIRLDNMNNVQQILPEIRCHQCPPLQSAAR